MDGGSAGNAGSSYQYTYDANSNRLSQLLNGETKNYEYNANSNQLTFIYTGFVYLELFMPDIKMSNHINYHKMKTKIIIQLKLFIIINYDKRHNFH